MFKRNRSVERLDKDQLEAFCKRLPAIARQSRLEVTVRTMNDNRMWRKDREEFCGTYSPGQTDALMKDLLAQQGKERYVFQERVYEYHDGIFGRGHHLVTFVTWDAGLYFEPAKRYTFKFKE